MEGDMQNLASAEVSTSDIGGLRLVLAASALLAYYDATSLEHRLLITGYAVFAAVLFVAATTSLIRMSRTVLWADVAWYCLLIWFSEPITSVLFLFFIFSILVAAFTYGFTEGRRITLATIGLYIAIVVLRDPIDQIIWDRLFLRTTFLFGLGMLISYWGGSETSLKEHLRILREVTRLSNPRFGIDLSAIQVMRKLKDYFQADSCLAVSFDEGSLQYTFRQTGTVTEQMYPAALPDDLVALLLKDAPGETVLFYHDAFNRRACLSHSAETERWCRRDAGHAEQIADFLNAKSFISVPVTAARGTGRLFLATGAFRYSRDAALLLKQIVEQAFAVLHQVELLDRMASEAAREERKRIVGDLHDSTIQPYIGLKLGLDGLKLRATPDNPLFPDLHTLSDMATHVIADLRSYVADLKREELSPEGSLYSALRRLVEKFSAYYGLHAQLQVDDTMKVPDRMAVEALQIVSEGLSNVHKHTGHRTATVRLSSRDHALVIEIENPASPGGGTAFTPSSIKRRAESLGGTLSTRVERNATTVRVTIPT